MNKNLDGLSLNEYHEILISELSNYFGYSKKEMQYMAGLMFLVEDEWIDNEEVKKIRKVSELSESEFIKYLERLKTWAEEFNFKFDQ